MKKTYRYILYFLIGVALYYVIKSDDNPGALNELHQHAPFLIIGTVILLMIVRYLKQKHDKDKGE